MSVSVGEEEEEEEVEVAQTQRCQAERVVVEEEEEEGNLPIQEEVEEVEEEEENLPIQEEAVAGRRCSTERLAVEGEVGGDMWVRSSLAEEGGGLCPLRVEVEEEEERSYWGPDWQEEAEAGCCRWGWRRLAGWGLMEGGQRCRNWTCIKKQNKTFF